LEKMKINGVEASGTKKGGFLIANSVGEGGKKSRQKKSAKTQNEIMFLKLVMRLGRSGGGVHTHKGRHGVT